MTYRLTKTWSDPHMQKLADWTCEMMNAAGPTAAGIGCSREAIIAQAALESAWGAAAIGHNLFGIKADASWHGMTQTVPTREVINGQSVMIDAAFRDYPSYADSIADHFAFLKANSRYAAAGVFNAGSDQAYFEALQRAGYATDPNYARSLMNMLASVKMFTACMVDDTASAPEPTVPPPGFVQTESGNVVLADIKSSDIVKGSNVGQVVTTVAGTAGTAAVGIHAVRSALDGITLSDVAIITLGVVAIAAMISALIYFRSIKRARLDMHDKGIA